MSPTSRRTSWRTIGRAAEACDLLDVYLCRLCRFRRSRAMALEHLGRDVRHTGTTLRHVREEWSGGRVGFRRPKPPAIGVVTSWDSGLCAALRLSRELLARLEGVVTWMPEERILFSGLVRQSAELVSYLADPGLLSRLEGDLREVESELPDAKWCHWTPGDPWEVDGLQAVVAISEAFGAF